MLEDVAKIRRVVLACGTVDLRKGIDGLSMITEINIIKIHLKKAPCFFSVAGALTELRDYFGWEMDFSCSISVLKQAPYLGRALQKRQLSLQRNNSIISCLG